MPAGGGESITGINPVPAVGPLLTPVARRYVLAGGDGFIAWIRPFPAVDGLPALPVPVVWVSEEPDRVTLAFVAPVPVAPVPVAPVPAVVVFLMTKLPSLSPEGLPGLPALDRPVPFPPWTVDFEGLDTRVL